MKNTVLKFFRFRIIMIFVPPLNHFRNTADIVVVFQMPHERDAVQFRNIPVYDGWLKDQESVYKADDLNSFETTIRQMLDGTLPKLTERGRTVAMERCFANIGCQLRDIYAAQGFVFEAEPAKQRDYRSGITHKPARYQYNSR